jgi:hypothetical protein
MDGHIQELHDALPTPRRSVKADRLQKALFWLEPYAEKADGWLGMRLTALTQGPFLIAIALCCALLAALMPILELLPLVSTVPPLPSQLSASPYLCTTDWPPFSDLLLLQSRLA